MNDVRPAEGTGRWVGWTVSDIDAAIEARWEKHAAALARGDLAAALNHEGWIDHLLDARPYVAARGPR